MCDYPQSQPNSHPCSPVSFDQNSLCSDVSSASEPPSFNAGQRLCWNGSGSPPQESLPTLQLQESGSPSKNDGSEENSMSLPTQDLSDIGEVHIQTAFADLPHEKAGWLDEVRSGTSASFESVYPLESGCLFEDTREDSQTLRFGDSKLCPVGAEVVDQADHLDGLYHGSVDTEFEFRPDLPSSHSRACDMVLSPFGGPRSVVRGAEALDEARRLAAMESQRSFKDREDEEANRSDDVSAEGLPTTAEWRKGLDMLHRLRAELGKDPGSHTIDNDKSASRPTEINELKDELHEETLDCPDVVAELRRELSIERAQARAERERLLVMESAGRDQESPRLAAELAVASAQEAAATAVATHLRAELIEAERRITEMSMLSESSPMCENEMLRLRAEAQSAANAEMTEFATVERLRAECDALKADLNTEAALVNAARRIAEDGEKVESKSERFSISLQTMNREYELQSALAASEHQREMDRVRLEADKQVLAAQVQLLKSELANQGSFHSEQSLQERETGAARLMEENRRLQCQLLSEFATAAAAAVEASAAASVAASSVAALQEESRAKRPTKQSPATPEGVAQFPQYSMLDLQERFASPVGQLLCSQNAPHDSPNKLALQAESPKDLLRASNAGDIAAGGTARQMIALAGYPPGDDLLENEVDSKDRRQEIEDDDALSLLSKPFLGGPLGLARALAMRSTSPISRSSARRVSGRKR